MSFVNLDDLLAGYALERKIKHWKKMASSGYLPRRRRYIKSFGKRTPTPIIKKGY